MNRVDRVSVNIDQLFLCKITVKDGIITILAYICRYKFKNSPMASRRKLKKTIKFVSFELITDVYLRCLKSKDVDDQKIDNIVVHIMSLNREYILRANRPDGKDNPTLVKAYFRKLFADWQTAMEEVIKEVESI